MKRRLEQYISQFYIFFCVLLAIFIPLFLGNYINIAYKIEIYSLSHAIKTLLMFLLPFVIFPFIVSNIMEMQAKGTYIICFILILVFISNFMSIMAAYGFGCLFIPLFDIHPFDTTHKLHEVINVAYTINLEPLLTIPQTLILSIISGVIISYNLKPFLKNFIETYVYYSRMFLEKIFINILPLYVFGTIIKMTHEINFFALIPVFGKIIFSIVIIVTGYIFLLFFGSQKGHIKSTFQAVKNTLPACIMGFSTMSSLMTLPVTLKSAAKNTKNTHLSQMTITTTVNFHDIGDCFSLPFVALAIYYIVNLSFPPFSTYVYFALVVALSQFSAVSVPNGSIAILLPILTTHFSFTDEMASLLIMLSVLLEPFGTAGNVMGNSVLVILVDKIFRKFSLI